MNNESCPCGSDKSYKICCELIISGDVKAETPEQLMRSRYSAYTKANIDYIFATMTGHALKNVDRNTTQEWAEQCEWLGLQVLDTTMLDEKEGYVEFIAKYRYGHQEHAMHERSRFIHENGQWLYESGKHISAPIATKNRIGCN